jgi:hypothetical protein
MSSLVTPASLTEWSIAIIGVIGAVGGLLKVSNCSTIKCLCIQCVRDRSIPDDELQNPDIELPAPTRLEIENRV